MESPLTNSVLLKDFSDYQRQSEWYSLLFLPMAQVVRQVDPYYTQYSASLSLSWLEQNQPFVLSNLQPSASASRIHVRLGSGSLTCCGYFAVHALSVTDNDFPCDEYIHGNRTHQETPNNLQSNRLIQPRFHVSVP